MRRTALMLCLAAALASPVSAEDPWYEQYEGALKAISSRKWAEAERKLKAAMASGPASGRRVRMYGVRSIDYLPEYHLGRVYYNQQRYADALEQLAKVQASGLVGEGDPEFHPLTDMAELCRIRTATKPAEAQREAAVLLRFARDLMARGSLEEARRALESARAKAPASAEVVTAIEDLARLETEARLRAEAERAKEPQARSFPLPAPTPTPAVAVPPLPGPSLDARPDSAAVRAAFESFYAGRYGDAADAFARLAREATPGRARFLAYEACSRGARALLRGPDAIEDLTRARRLLAEAGSAGARALAADPLVSPRLRGALAP